MVIKNKFHFFFIISMYNWVVYSCPQIFLMCFWSVRACEPVRFSEIRWDCLVLNLSIVMKISEHVHQDGDSSYLPFVLLRYSTAQKSSFSKSSHHVSQIMAQIFWLWNKKIIFVFSYCCSFEERILVHE